MIILMRGKAEDERVDADLGVGSGAATAVLLEVKKPSRSPALAPSLSSIVNCPVLAAKAGFESGPRNKKKKVDIQSP